VLLLTAIALAKESEFVEVELDRPVDAPDSTLAAEFGGAWSAGNTDSRTVSAKVDASYRWDANRFSTVSGGVLGSARVDQNGDGVLDEQEREQERVKTAQRGTAHVRYDRYLNPRTSLYSLGGGYTDPFAGYDGRLNAQVGTSRLVLGDASEHTPQETRLVAEIGFDAAHENYTAGVAPETDWMYSARGELELHQDLTERLEVGQEAEVFVNVVDPQDARFISDTSVTNDLTDTLSVKFTYTLRYDTDPVAGYVPADHQGLVTLVAKVL